MGILMHKLEYNGLKAALQTDGLSIIYDRDKLHLFAQLPCVYVTGFVLQIVCQIHILNLVLQNRPFIASL